MTPAVYNSIVKLEKYKPFGLPREYNHIDPDSRLAVDSRSPLEFYAYCSERLLTGEPIPILLDVPF